MGRSRKIELRLIAWALGSLFLFPFPSYGQTAFHSPQQSKGTAPTVAEASKFADEAEKRLFDLQVKASRASWVQENFITDDTEQVAADANEALDAATTELAGKARRFDGLKLPEGVARKLKLLKLSSIFPAPRNSADQKELAKLAASLDGDYGKGVWCPDGEKGKCLDVTAIERLMATNRDPEQLKRAWLGWHAIGAPMRKRFERFVELGNKGSREMGFQDAGALWRSKYDMPPDAFAKEVDRLWEQVRPLYLSLHAYVRSKLREKYGASVVPSDGPIPADLLGNMWAQSWENIYPLVAPADADPGFDLTQILKSKNTEPKQMARYGEGFFTSLGFPPLPPSFWERSLFIKPRDREVVCHASAWDVDAEEDLRIKMCIDITGEDFTTIHHELGHNFYQRAYKHQPYLFRDSANDGFHEAVGDTIALSVTPEYFSKIGLLKTAPDPSKDIGLLLQKALEKIAFLPFGLLIDQWRWKVFAGEVAPAAYNKAWWDLRLKYQGVVPPSSRG